MSQEESPKEEKGKIHNPQPDINKAQEHDRSYGYTKLHSEIGILREGYQPIVNITTTPPDGGSGVPNKSDE